MQSAYLAEVYRLRRYEVTLQLPLTRVLVRAIDLVLADQVYSPCAVDQVPSDVDAAGTDTDNHNVLQCLVSHTARGDTLGPTCLAYDSGRR